MTIKVFYHNVSEGVPCPDGIAAAWVVRRAFSGTNASWDVKEKSLFFPIEYIGCEYQKTIPDVSPGDAVYVLDFSFPAEVLEGWKAITNGDVVVIDHHENKMKELMGVASIRDLITFDNSKCGALLTWEYFFPDTEPPAFLRYIDDRDRWQHLLPFTHEIHAAVGKLGRSFEVFDALSKLTEQDLMTLLKKLGSDALAERRKVVEEIAGRWQMWDELAGIEYGDGFPVVVLQENERWATSDICSLLYKRFPDAPFVATVTITPEGETWSLRSDQHGNNTDVAAIAAKFGGGGHRNAAGFRVKASEGL